jgi:hypothetical protein
VQVRKKLTNSIGLHIIKKNFPTRGKEDLRVDGGLRMNNLSSSLAVTVM